MYPGLGNPDTCTICTSITNGACGCSGIVYRVDCLICPEGEMFYEGEAYGEHWKMESSTTQKNTGTVIVALKFDLG